MSRCTSASGTDGFRRERANSPRSIEIVCVAVRLFHRSVIGCVDSSKTEGEAGHFVSGRYCIVIDLICDTFCDKNLSAKNNGDKHNSIDD